jgi:hypothetical protein
MLCLAPASSAATVNPVLVFPMPVLAAIPDEPPPIALPLGMGDWVWEMMMDHLTVPLAPGDQNVWPLWMWRDQWFIAYHRVQQEGTWDGLTPPSPVALTTGIAMSASVLAAETRVPVTTRITGLTTRPGGKTCDTS